MKSLDEMMAALGLQLDVLLAMATEIGKAFQNSSSSDGENEDEEDNKAKSD